MKKQELKFINLPKITWMVICQTTVSSMISLLAYSLCPDPPPPTYIFNLDVETPKCLKENSRNGVEVGHTKCMQNRSGVFLSYCQFISFSSPTKTSYELGGRAQVLWIQLSPCPALQKYMGPDSDSTIRTLHSQSFLSFLIPRANSQVWRI